MKHDSNTRYGVAVLALIGFFLGCGADQSDAFPAESHTRMGKRPSRVSNAVRLVDFESDVFQPFVKSA